MIKHKMLEFTSLENLGRKTGSNQLIISDFQWKRLGLYLQFRTFTELICMLSDALQEKYVLDCAL